MYFELCMGRRYNSFRCKLCSRDGSLVKEVGLPVCTPSTPTSHVKSQDGEECADSTIHVTFNLSRLLETFVENSTRLRLEIDYEALHSGNEIRLCFSEDIEWESFVARRSPSNRAASKLAISCTVASENSVCVEGTSWATTIDAPIFISWDSSCPHTVAVPEAGVLCYRIKYSNQDWICSG